MATCYSNTRPPKTSFSYGSLFQPAPVWPPETSGAALRPGRQRVCPGAGRAPPPLFFFLNSMKSLRYALLFVGLLVGGLQQAAAQMFEWAKLTQNLGRNDGFGQAATTDLAGNTYTSVRFRDSVRVGNLRFRATGSADVLVKYDSTGHVAWAKLMRGVSFELGGLKVNPATGDLFMLGRL